MHKISITTAHTHAISKTLFPISPSMIASMCESCKWLAERSRVSNPCVLAKISPVFRDVMGGVGEGQNDATRTAGLMTLFSQYETTFRLWIGQT